MNQNISVSSFIYYGLEILNRNRPTLDTRWTTVNQRRWSTNFGTSPSICQVIWGLITSNNEEPLPNGANFFHILWTLLFLKLYMSESVLSGLVGVDEKSYRKWIWIFTPKIAQLKPKIVSNTSFLK